MLRRVFTSPAGAVAKYCDAYVCLSVCLVCPRGWAKCNLRLPCFKRLRLMTVCRLWSLDKSKQHEEFKQRRVLLVLDDALSSRMSISSSLRGCWHCARHLHRSHGSQCFDRCEY